MQFHVPQFIDVEDKIIGPLSWKQFLWVGGALGVFIFTWLTFGSILLGLIFSSPILALGFSLAFYRVNNRPFIYLLESVYNYALSAKLYVWKKIDRPVEHKEESQEIETDVFVPKLSNSKLKDLAWSLDIQEKGGVYKEGE